MTIERLVVVSNRLPIVLGQDLEGSWTARPGSGGLVTALAPVLRDRGGMWIGWLGTTDELALQAVADTDPEGVGYALEPVSLTADELDNYYFGFSNEILWPLFHDLPGHCNYDPGYWPYYQQVNRKFVESIALSTRVEDYIWVQDYHLMLVAEEMRRMGLRRTTGFFLHIPFPPLDIFMKLPWRFQVLRALLEFDLVGFQTTRDLRNFIQCVRTTMPKVRITGRGMAATATVRDRELQLGAFPIGIDYKRFNDEAHSQEVMDRAWFIHEDLPERKLILGIDRLDYTKGIPERIKALGMALQRHPQLQRKITYIQVVVPSREDVPEYQQLRHEIEQLVGQVNGQFTTSGWTPIHYIYRPLERTELISYYRTAEVALITPLKDGMNLVAKEYCACSVDDGVLVLSEFAGAAAQLQQGALLVNPFDIEGVAEAIHRAVTMDDQDRRQRMRKLRRSVQRQSVFWWVDSFLRAAIQRDLRSFPHVDHYVPTDPEEVDEGEDGAEGGPR